MLVDGVDRGGDLYPAEVRRVEPPVTLGLAHGEAGEDPAAFGRTVEAVIEVKLNAEQPAVAFEASLRHLPQVVSATLMTGSYDYAVRVACVDRDDLVSVTETLRRQGVRETYTRLVLREVQLGAA